MRKNPVVVQLVSSVANTMGEKDRQYCQCYHLSDQYQWVQQTKLNKKEKETVVVPIPIDEKRPVEREGGGGGER